MNRIETNDETTEWKKSKSATTAPTPKLRKNQYQKGKPENLNKRKQMHLRSNLPKKKKKHTKEQI